MAACWSAFRVAVLYDLIRVCCQPLKDGETYDLLRQRFESFGNDFLNCSALLHGKGGAFSVDRRHCTTFFLADE
jgi:hypothetical protein